VINKIINEIYHTVGLAGERTKQDNAMGIDNSSGVAKAYDFERVNAALGEGRCTAGGREQMKTMIDKLFPQLAKDIKAKMLAELKDWPPDLATLLASPDGQALQGASSKGLAKSSLSTPGTPGQGSVK
jgi:hypothetical protein